MTENRAETPTDAKPALVLEVFPTAEDAADAAAARVFTALPSQEEGTRAVAVGLPGGSSAIPMFRSLLPMLLAKQVAWDRVTLFLGDERIVRADDPRSNCRQAIQAVLHAIPRARERLLCPTHGRSPEELANDYEERMTARLGTPPVVDLMVLGVGTDGHILSLFPGCPALSESQHLFTTSVDPEGLPRITATRKLLGAARRVILLGLGPSKRGVLTRLLAGKLDNDIEAFPVALLKELRTEVHIIVDQEAAPHEAQCQARGRSSSRRSSS